LLKKSKGLSPKNENTGIYMGNEEKTGVVKRKIVVSKPFLQKG